jgi:hypothetical protein
VKYLFFSVIIVFLGGCDLREKRDRADGAVYVKPSVDRRGRFRSGHVRMPVSAKKDAYKSQARSRYYYQTRGKYRSRK